MNDTSLFAFERDFVATLRCIPMAVRFKLDRCAIKLSLRQWSRFTRDDRQGLLLQACGTAEEIATYRATLVALVSLHALEAAKPLAEPPPPLWENASQAPAPDFAGSRGAPAPSPGQWAALSDLQRFVLIKLTRDNHDNLNFIPAMIEFGLITDRLQSAA
jgi:hypothetical protein